MAKQITIRIYPDGKVEAKTVGIKGKACLKYLQPLEQLLEAEAVDSEFTKEYYETEVGEVQQERRNIEIN